MSGVIHLKMPLGVKGVTGDFFLSWQLKYIFHYFSDQNKFSHYFWQSPTTVTICLAILWIMSGKLPSLHMVVLPRMPS